VAALKKDPLCLVDAVTPGSEGHHIVTGDTGKPRYRVGYENPSEGAPATVAAGSSDCGGSSGPAVAGPVSCGAVVAVGAVCAALLMLHK